MRRIVRQPWVVVVVVCGTLWALLLTALALGRFEGDARGFLFAGAAFSRPPGLAGVPVLSQYGYDGQFYAVLATDPLLLEADTPRHLDAPAFRAARLGAPLVAWLLGLGEPRAAVLMYLLLCWAGALALLGLVAAWLTEGGGSPWWAVAVGASGGLATSMLRATPDALAVALALGGLWLATKGRHRLALALLTGACVTRETMLLMALGAAVATLFAGRRWVAARYALVPTGVYLAWRFVLAARLGGSWWDTGGNVGAPLAWVGSKVASLARGEAGALGMEVWGTLAVVTGLVGALLLIRRHLRHAPAAALAFFALLGVALTHQVLAEAYAYTRVLLPLSVLALLASTETRWFARLWLYLPTMFQALAGLAMVRVELGATFPALANLKEYLFR